ncbi:MAG: sugar ABC transporter permease, partial [Clostridia bacterium]|nr:sugar ABC transporter permease [Clostridia bacterium]
MQKSPETHKYKRMSFFKAIRMYKWLYLMLIIPLTQYILFRYAPLSGLQVAFKEFSVFKGIEGSPWATPIFKYFSEVFGSPQFWNAVKNTVKLNLLDLIFGFPMPIILAIMVYEMRSLKVKKLYQTLMYL